LVIAEMVNSFFSLDYNDPMTCYPVYKAAFN
jgi:hypothetical protein